MAQRFIELLMMLGQQAAMSLGMRPHPATGRAQQNPEAARMFIDLLEMLQEKTRGNLSTEEAKALRGMLSDLQLEYVRLTGDITAGPSSPEPDDEELAEDAPPAPAAAAPAPSRPATPPPTAKPASGGSVISSGSTSEEQEDKKRFRKSYGAF